LGDSPRDSPGDRDPDIMPSLTYAELAEALRITPASANKLARRRRWPRLMGNDGKARVAVPEDALVRPDVPPPSPGDSPPDNNPVHVQIARLEGELAGVREAPTEARARAQAAEARAEAAETRIEISWPNSPTGEHSTPTNAPCFSPKWRQSGRTQRRRSRRSAPWQIGSTRWPLRTSASPS